MFKLKEINWALVLVLFVVVIAATYITQITTVDETLTTDDEEGSVSITSRKISLFSKKDEE